MPILCVLAAGGWLAWAATTEGGVGARVGGMFDRVRGTVEHATEDPGLKRAATFFNERYAREGGYPQLTEAEMREDPDIDWGAGVTTLWCGPRAMVISGLTARGTLSRLLLDGATYGDVHGQAACPADISRPLPWSRD